MCKERVALFLGSPPVDEFLVKRVAMTENVPPYIDSANADSLPKAVNGCRSHLGTEHEVPGTVCREIPARWGLTR